MIDFLALALEQEETEEAEKAVPFEFRSAGAKVPGASFAQKRPPNLRKAPGGEGFPRGSALNDRGRGPAGPLLPDPSRGFFNGRSLVPAAYSAATPGLNRRGVLTERLRVPGARSEDQGQEPGELVSGRSAEVPLMAAVRRAERVADFVGGPRRKLTVALPGNVGGEAAGVSVETLDRMVERDARRYGGPSPLY